MSNSNVPECIGPEMVCGEERRAALANPSCAATVCCAQVRTQNAHLTWGGRQSAGAERRSPGSALLCTILLYLLEDVERARIPQVHCTRSAAAAAVIVFVVVVVIVVDCSLVSCLSSLISIVLLFLLISAQQTETKYIIILQENI